jgi:uncharacterized repeat protein (TIGR03803 family)
MSGRRRFHESFCVAMLPAVAVVFFATTVCAQTYQVLQSFETEGQNPQAALILGADGAFYGTTPGGGNAGVGTVYRIDSDGTTTTLHSFSQADGIHPNAALLQADDDNLYGTTDNTIFRIAPDGTGFANLHGLTGSYGGALIQAADGFLYGTTQQGGPANSGTIFMMDTDGAQLTTLYSFAVSDGASPRGHLIQLGDGMLYGTTSSGGANGGGTIFRIDTEGTTLSTLHDFDGDDGYSPYTGLIEGQDGSLYGTTIGGGANGEGTVFRIDAAGTTLTTLHSFALSGEGTNPRGELIQGQDGFLYGTTLEGGGPGIGGTIFRIDVNGMALTTIHGLTSPEGLSSYAGLVQAGNGELYGTTEGTGSFPHQYGTVFHVDTAGTTFATLHAFAPFHDGETSRAGLVQGLDGKLYGTTYAGGANGFGTVFRIGSDGSAFESLHDFTFTDGARPQAALIRSADGNLYGTTSTGGGGSGKGTVFQLVPGDGTLTTLHVFSGTDGASPYGSLVQGMDGNLYGTTQSGGATANFGTVFRVDTAGLTFASLYSFAGPDGWGPSAALLQVGGADLYGTTTFGGASGQGTIFKIDTAGTALTTLHSFASTDGANPRTALIRGGDGLLYGTTDVGGTSVYGTIFQIDTAGATLTTLHSFIRDDGAGPGTLLQAPDGLLYGMTSFGGGGNCTASGCGIVYSLDTAGTTLTTLHHFAPEDGAQPYGSLLLAADGSFCATTAYGGPADGGVVFRIAACSIPTITPSGPTIFCAGGSVTLDAGAGYATYLWSPGGQQTETILVSSSGSYTVAVTDGTGCGTASAPTTVTVNPAPAPVITATQCVPPNTPGLTASVATSGTDAYAWTLTGGTLDSGQGSNEISFTSGGPGTAMHLSIDETSAATCVGSATLALQTDFNDVPSGDPFYSYVCRIGRNGITAGCGGGSYCRDDAVLRSQMAVFLLKAMHGSSFVPPTCTGIFSDVPCPSQFADWTEELFHEGITGGCGGGNYCPSSPVTRAQMAVFLLKAEHGSAYLPPSCTGTFLDVPCPGTFTNWIEQLALEQITSGCGNGNYCPANPQTRGQMAVFLTKTFNLQ